MIGAYPSSPISQVAVGSPDKNQLIQQRTPVASPIRRFPKRSIQTNAARLSLPRCAPELSPPCLESNDQRQPQEEIDSYAPQIDSVRRKLHRREFMRLGSEIRNLRGRTRRLACSRPRPGFGTRRKPAAVPGMLTIPPSSQVNAEDRGKRAHTNVRFIMPATAGPLEAPPYSGYAYETPACWPAYIAW